MVDPDRAAFQQVATTKLPRARLPDSGWEEFVVRPGIL